MSDRSLEHVLLCPIHGKVLYWVEGPGQQSTVPLGECPAIIEEDGEKCGAPLDHRVRTLKVEPPAPNVDPLNLKEWQQLNG